MITGRGVSSETASVLVTFGRREYSTIVLTSSWTTWSCSRWCRWYTSVTKNTFQTVFLNKSRTNASVMERPCTFLCVRIGSKTYVTNCNRENITGSCSCSAVDHKSIVVRAIPYRSTKHDDHEGRIYALWPLLVTYIGVHEEVRTTNWTVPYPDMQLTIRWAVSFPPVTKDVTRRSATCLSVRSYHPIFEWKRYVRER